MNVVEQIDAGARSILAASGLGAKIRALGQTVAVVQGWAELNERLGLAQALGLAGRSLRQLGEKIAPTKQFSLRGMGGDRKRRSSKAGEP